MKKNYYLTYLDKQNAITYYDQGYSKRSICKNRLENFSMSPQKARTTRLLRGDGQGLLYIYVLTVY